MRRLLNSMLVVIWVLAQTITAAQSHGSMAGHMMPAAVSQQQVMVHNHQQPGQHDHASMMHGNASDTDQMHRCARAGGTESSGPCCKDMQCQATGILGDPGSTPRLGNSPVYFTLSARQSGVAPTFVLPPPNLHA